eukprot:6182676-Pleurochrysis_carterae.AAC.1
MPGGKCCARNVWRPMRGSDDMPISTTYRQQGKQGSKGVPSDRKGQGRPQGKLNNSAPGELRSPHKEERTTKSAYTTICLATAECSAMELDCVWKAEKEVVPETAATGSGRKTALPRQGQPMPGVADQPLYCPCVA